MAKIYETLQSGATIGGSFLLLLTTFYYMKSFVYSLGFYSGVSTILGTYNLTLSQSLSAIIPQPSTIILAIYITYVMTPIALMTFIIGLAWFLTRQRGRGMAIVVIFSSIFYATMAAMLELNFRFGSSSPPYYLSYLGCALCLVGGGSVLLQGRHPTRARATSVAINPDTPFTNISIISNRIIGKMSDELKILDMHFDLVGLNNLAKILKGKETRYKSIKVLSKRERLNSEFGLSFSDFKRELMNSGVSFELRVMSDQTASEQHERLILDHRLAYKIPPLNIINKKSEHLVGVNHGHAEQRFDKIWAVSTAYENLRQ